MIKPNLNSRRAVQLTPTGPVLVTGDISSITAFETIEVVDNATWQTLQEVLQTGKLDNAKVKEIIEANQ